MCSRTLVGCPISLQRGFQLDGGGGGTRAVSSRCGRVLLSHSADACALLTTSSDPKAKLKVQYNNGTTDFGLPNLGRYLSIYGPTINIIRDPRWYE